MNYYVHSNFPTPPLLFFSVVVMQTNPVWAGHPFFTAGPSILGATGNRLVPEMCKGPGDQPGKAF